MKRGTGIAPGKPSERTFASSSPSRNGSRGTLPLEKVPMLFGKFTRFDQRYIPDHQKLLNLVKECKKAGFRVALVQGTYDLAHIGHARYIEKARENADIVILGVDSDIKVKRRKGENRPIVPQEERLEFLSHFRSVDIITIKNDDDPKWHLIKLLEPDVLIATQQTYQPEELAALKEFCGEVKVFPPQAETSTTARIRLLLVSPGKEILDGLDKVQLRIIEEMHNLKTLARALIGGGKGE